MGSHNWLFWSPVNDEGYFVRDQILAIATKSNYTSKTALDQKGWIWIIKFRREPSDLHFDFAGYIEINPAVRLFLSSPKIGSSHNVCQAWRMASPLICTTWKDRDEMKSHHGCVIKNVDPWPAWVEKWIEMIGNACLLVWLKGQPKLSYSSNQNHNHFPGRNICLFITQPSESPALRIKSRSARSASEAYLNPWFFRGAETGPAFQKKRYEAQGETIKPGKDRIVSPWSPHLPITMKPWDVCTPNVPKCAQPLSWESFISK